MSLKLFVVHCGFYDPALFDGFYESHADLLIAAGDAAEAKRRAQAAPEFRGKNMHVDGLREVTEVDGLRVVLA